MTPSLSYSSALTTLVAVFALTSLFGCSSSELSGQWVIDAQATLRSQSEGSLSAMSPGFPEKRINEMARDLTVEFHGSNEVTVRRNGKSVTRRYDVIRTEGETRALAIYLGHHQLRRVIVLQDKTRLVMVDNHRRILLRKK